MHTSEIARKMLSHKLRFHHPGYHLLFCSSIYYFLLPPARFHNLFSHVQNGRPMDTLYILYLKVLLFRITVNHIVKRAILLLTVV